ncbi:MAG TPA: hypothetical protein VL361_03990 [Candidatus Limnocylindrales bacterium]|nr:hypothetical protein [Candidatus Limnocylindrales bacterium]
MKRLLPSSLFAASLAYHYPGFTQSILLPDPNETAGERPYEMVWANRTEPAPPTLRFVQLDGWKLEASNGAQATLQVSRAQNVWNRPVARLRYHGDGKKDSNPSIVLIPAQPVALPDNADCLDMWLYGNRWDWENPPGTPPVDVFLKLRDGAGKEEELRVDHVRWQEWWLVHRKLAGALRTPVRLLQIKVNGGWQTEWREIFFDSIRFYREELPSITFSNRPQRNLRLPEGQSVGANIGPGRLPFPTREKTILPMHFAGKYSNGLTDSGAGQYSLDYRAKDCAIVYSFDPTKGLGGVEIWFTHELGARPLDGASIKLRDGPTDSTLKSVKQDGKTILAEYGDGTTLRLQIWQKSLIVDVSNTTGQATELKFGKISGVIEPRTIAIPYLTYGSGPRPCALLSRAGTNHFFTSLWLDWYRSNGSEPYAAESASTNTAQINGGVRYHPRTDGKLNPLFERLFITVSPTFEEVLPTVANPVGIHAKQAVDRLWQESWGPDDYEKQMKRSRMLRAYGIEKLIQCNHEIAWRDGGESFTLRTRAAPKKGGDAALGRYVEHQRGLGWFEGLYSNYTDYAPVNEFWSPDGVQRLSDGNWRSAWPRCWAEKPLKAVEFDAMLAPQIKKKFNPNSAYTDVQTAVSPWGYNDYDVRVPGAGSFAQTFYAYGELLRNDSRVYGGPIFSEGTYQWLYAGLADGNYALAYDGHPLAKEPLLPVFDLYQIHSKECDIGMGWTANFCDAMPDWKKPEHIDRAIDWFLLHTLAYGHIGWLVEQEHGIERTCRSYYMLQQVQARYGLKTPVRVAYWDGAQLVSVSEALSRDLPRTRRQLFVEYSGGLQLWLNDHPTETWRMSAIKPQTDGTPHPDVLPLEGERQNYRQFATDLPPAGWAACTPNGDLYSFSGLEGTNRVDYLRSREYTYVDGRGHWVDTPEAVCDGALAIRLLGKNKLSLIYISGAGPFVIRRPYKIRGTCLSCEAFDVEGKPLPKPEYQDNGMETRIKPREQAINYVLTFSEKLYGEQVHQ